MPRSYQATPAGSARPEAGRKHDGHDRQRTYEPSSQTPTRVTLMWNLQRRIRSASPPCQAVPMPERPESVVVRRRVLSVVAVIAAVLVVVARPADAAALVRAAADGTEELLSWWQAVILGVVEGITEYLPISSTGHLLVTSRLLGLPSEEGSAGLEAVNTYAIAIQFGAILAVVGLFWRRFRSMILGLFGRDDDGRQLLVVLVIAFLPSALVGFLFDD